MYDPVMDPTRLERFIAEAIAAHEINPYVIYGVRYFTVYSDPVIVGKTLAQINARVGTNLESADELRECLRALGFSEHRDQGDMGVIWADQTAS